MRLLIAVVAFASACSNSPNSQPPERAAKSEPAPTVTPQDTSPAADSPLARSWLRWTDDPPSMRRGVVKVDSKSIARVAQDSIGRATELLRDTPWKLVSAKEAAQLVGHPIANAEAGVVVLLRGVDMAHGDSEKDTQRQVDTITVVEHKGRTIVATVGYRFADYAIHPCPIVAVLPGVPTDVYAELRYMHPTHAINNDGPAGH